MAKAANEMTVLEARHYVMARYHVHGRLTGTKAYQIVALEDFLKANGLRLKADNHGRVVICDRGFNPIVQTTLI